jgi:hypothetical protein
MHRWQVCRSRLFPVNDGAAARAWFGDPSNNDFQKWETAKVDSSDEWAALEIVLSAVAGLKPHDIKKKVKHIIPGHVPGENLTARATLAQRKRIAEQATAGMMDGIDVSWNEVSKEWLVGALTVFARKVIQLWKKGQSRKEVKSKSGERGAEGEPPAKKRRANAGSDGIGSSRSGDGEKGKYHPGGIEQSAGQPRSHHSAHMLSRPPLPLDDCEIEVRMIDGTCISVATAAILRDSKGDCFGTEVRIEPLDYERLMAIIHAMGRFLEGRSP